MWKTYKNTRYRVSDSGEVFSSISNKILKPIDDGNGYLAVSLYIDGMSEKYKIHRLVAEVFIENTSNLLTVNHKDGNKLNNNVDNLEWMSQGDNTKHAWTSGLMLKGEQTPIAKLTDESVEKVIELFYAGMTNQQIGEMFGVARGTISKIRDRKTWRHIRPDVLVFPSTLGNTAGYKLSIDDVKEIRDLFSKGVSIQDLSKIYKVHNGTINSIVNYKTYKNI